MPPSGSAREFRDGGYDSPPTPRVGASSAASVSSVTAFDHQAPADPRPASSTPASPAPPPTNCIGRGQRGRGRGAFNNLGAQAHRRRRCAQAAPRVACVVQSRDRRIAGSAQPFDRYWSRPRHVPQQFTAARAGPTASRCGFALGGRPSRAPAKSYGKATRASTRAPGAASTSIATVLSASAGPRSDAAAVVARMLCADHTERFQHAQAAEARVREPALPGTVAAGRRAKMRAPGCRCGCTTFPPNRREPK